MKNALLWLRLILLVYSVILLVTVFLQNKTDIVFIFAVTSDSELAIIILFLVLAIHPIPATTFTILRDRKNSVTF